MNDWWSCPQAGQEDRDGARETIDDAREMIDDEKHHIKVMLLSLPFDIQFDMRIQKTSQ